MQSHQTISSRLAESVRFARHSNIPSVGIRVLYLKISGPSSIIQSLSAGNYIYDTAGTCKLNPMRRRPLCSFFLENIVLFWPFKCMMDRLVGSAFPRASGVAFLEPCLESDYTVWCTANPLRLRVARSPFVTGNQLVDLLLIVWRACIGMTGHPTCP